MTGLVDSLASLPTTEIKCLDDGHVRLVDCMPRLHPSNHTMEYAIAECARTSYGNGSKDLASDVKLIRYLYKNQHTSPFESVKFKFYIRCPKFVAIHLLRHRTANFNEFSQRYAKIKDDAFYHPSAVANGIRVASTLNKQGSTPIDDTAKQAALLEEVKKAERLCDELFVSYNKLIGMGLAKEIARFCLPEAVYTELYFTMDLHNLLRFLRLRMDADHAQYETVVYARAIHDLIAPLVPNVLEAFREYTLSAMTLSVKEISALRDGTGLVSESKSDQDEFAKKLDRLGVEDD